MVAMVHVRDSIVQHQKFHAIFAVASAALHKQQSVVHITVSTNRHIQTCVCKSMLFGV